jgi:hypothetical protein
MVRKIGVIALSIIGALTLTACSSSQIYSGSKSVGVFVAIPKGWNKISQSAIHKREMQSTSPVVRERAQAVAFQEAYSFSPNVKPDEVLSVTAPKDAIVYLRVRDLNGDEMNTVSYNWLRDLIFPLTTWLGGSGSNIPQWELIDDLENVQRGARGVQTVFAVTASDKVSQTISQTALVSDDRSRIYFLLIRAKTSWYNTHKATLKKIADSFTVRGNR